MGTKSLSRVGVVTLDWRDITSCSAWAASCVTFHVGGNLSARHATLLRHGPARDRECPRYDIRAHGASLGCTLDDITALPTSVMVTVNGSSRTGAVSCSDAAVDLSAVGESNAHWDPLCALRDPLSAIPDQLCARGPTVCIPRTTVHLRGDPLCAHGGSAVHTVGSLSFKPLLREGKIYSRRMAVQQCTSPPDLAPDPAPTEILTPPTLTAECNSSEAHVRWDMSSRFHSDFEYTLQINKVRVLSAQWWVLGAEWWLLSAGLSL